MKKMNRLVVVTILVITLLSGCKNPEAGTEQSAEVAEATLDNEAAENEETLSKEQSADETSAGENAGEDAETDEVEAESAEEGPVGEATKVIYTMEEDDYGTFEDSEIGSIGMSKFFIWLYQNLDYNYPHILIIKENRDVIDVKEGESYHLEATDKIYIWPFCQARIPDSVLREDEVLGEYGLVCFPQVAEVAFPGVDTSIYFQQDDYSMRDGLCIIVEPDYTQFESPQKVSCTSFTTTGEEENRVTTVYLYAPGQE